MSPGPVEPAREPATAFQAPFAGTRRWLFFGVVTATMLGGTLMMVDIVGYAGVTALEVVILTLFTPTFSWITIAFWNAVVGFTLQALGRDPLSLRRDPLLLRRTGEVREGAAPIATRTALVMPAYNEDPQRVVGGLAAMIRSLEYTGHGEHFDVYLLSDTTDPAIAREEELAWTTLRTRIDRPEGLYYRRRPANTGRKAGNIADFCKRWGRHYDFMIVLDADSIMTGPTLVRLARAMEANPDAGLIQTVPIPARQETLFGRLVQFAARLYSPMLATGQAFWQTDSGNYWGHNAIIRADAFSKHCTLPVLPGTPPLGGPVLSHDFVEAALLRRAGWKVYMLPQLGGSYEEVPGNVIEYAKRDRRWSQGSLQHLRLLATRGLHSMNRLHFVLGAMGYVSSLLWLLMLLAGTGYVLGPLVGDRVGSEAPLFHLNWRLPPGSDLVSLLAVTAVLLFVPKILGLLLVLGRERKAFAGPVRLLASALLETLFAVVIAPLMMMYHSRFVLSVLFGRDIEWEPPMRRGRAVAWREALRRTAGVTAIGAIWASATLYYSPLFFLWLTPIFAGLLLAAPLVWGTSSTKAGQWTRRRGLFLVPSETSNPAELQLSTWSGIAPTGAHLREPTPSSARLSRVPPEWPRAMPGRSSARRRGAARADAVEVARRGR